MRPDDGVRSSEGRCFFVKRMKDNKGMTLVELIIAVAFTAIVITAACSMLYLAGNFFKSGTANATNQQNASLVESYLQRYAATASQVLRINSASTSLGEEFTFSADGNLSIDDHSVTGSSAKTSVPGIKQVGLDVTDKILTYTIVSKDGTYTLKGGIVLNNYKGDNVPSFELNGTNGYHLFLGLTTS